VNKDEIILNKKEWHSDCKQIKEDTNNRRQLILGLRPKKKQTEKKYRPPVLSLK
jgi:hypothetical protein